MARTSHPVKRADGTASAIFRQMDIDDGGMDGLMAKEGLDGEQVGAVLVKMGAESMPQGVAVWGKGIPWDARIRTSTV